MRPSVSCTSAWFENSGHRQVIERLSKAAEHGTLNPSPILIYRVRNEAGSFTTNNIVNTES